MWVFMSCACEQKILGSQYGRIKKLAKAYAKMQQQSVAIYRNADGTYGFALAASEINKSIVEYISHY